MRSRGSARWRILLSCSQPPLTLVASSTIIRHLVLSSTDRSQTSPFRPFHFVISSSQLKHGLLLLLRWPEVVPRIISFSKQLPPLFTICPNGLSFPFCIFSKRWNSISLIHNDLTWFPLGHETRISISWPTVTRRVRSRVGIVEVLPDVYRRSRSICRAWCGVTGRRRVPRIHRQRQVILGQRRKSSAVSNAHRPTSASSVRADHARAGRLELRSRASTAGAEHRAETKEQQPDDGRTESEADDANDEQVVKANCAAIDTVDGRGNRRSEVNGCINQWNIKYSTLQSQPLCIGWSDVTIIYGHVV